MRPGRVVVAVVAVWLAVPVSGVLAQDAVGVPQITAGIESEQEDKVIEEIKKEEKKDPLVFGDSNTFWGRPTLQYRLRPEFRKNADLNKDIADDTLIAFQRARIGLKLNYSNWIETFVQFQDVRTFGYMNTSVAYGGNTDLHQAWVKFKLFEDRVSLKIGRQQLVYGDQRLIGHLEWANTPRVFDALVLRVNNKLGWTDAFASTFSSEPGGNLIDYVTVFTGLYNEMFFANKAIVWDLYLLGLLDGESARAPGVLYDADDTTQVSPSRRIGTAGTRLRFNGKGLSAGLEAAYQFGKANYEPDVDLSQSSFAVHGDVKYGFAIPTKPWVKLGGNYATGQDADGDKSTRFINLFPTNHKFYGFMDLANWSNALNANLQAGFSPTKRITVFADYWMLARANTDDGWYNAGGKPLTDMSAPSDYDDDKLLGHEVDLTVKIPIIKQVSTMSGVSFFLPAGYGLARGEDAQVWAYIMLAVSI